MSRLPNGCRRIQSEQVENLNETPSLGLQHANRRDRSMGIWHARAVMAVTDYSNRHRDARRQQSGFHRPPSGRPPFPASWAGGDRGELLAHNRRDLGRRGTVGTRWSYLDAVDRGIYGARRGREIASVQFTQRLRDDLDCLELSDGRFGPPNSPIKSFPDLIRRAKETPGKLTFAMNLPGSLMHLLGELINVEAGVEMVGVPYRSSPQALTDVIGGRVDAMIDTGTFSFQQINGGVLRRLAVSSGKRFKLKSQIPAISETLPSVDVTSWLGLAAAAATPQTIVERLNKEIQRFSRFPKFKASSPASETCRCRRRHKK